MYSFIYICLVLCLISTVHSCSSDEVTAKAIINHGNTISNEHIYIVDTTTHLIVQIFECYKCKSQYTMNSICLASNHEFRVDLTSSGNGWVSASYFTLSINGNTILDKVRLDSGDLKYYSFITPDASFDMISILPTIIMYGVAIIAIVALVLNRKKRHSRNLALHPQTGQQVVVGYPNGMNTVSNYDGKVPVIANPYNSGTAVATAIPYNPSTTNSASTSPIPYNPSTTKSASATAIPYNPSATKSVSATAIPYNPSTTKSASTTPIPYNPSTTVSALATAIPYNPSSTVSDPSVIMVEPMPYMPYNPSTSDTKPISYIPYDPSMNTGISSSFATPQNPQSFI